MLGHLDGPTMVLRSSLGHVSSPFEEEVVKIDPRIAVENEPLGFNPVAVPEQLRTLPPGGPTPRCLYLAAGQVSAERRAQDKQQGKTGLPGSSQSTHYGRVPAFASRLPPWETCRRL